jgi:hypothetical protein
MSSTYADTVPPRNIQFRRSKAKHMTVGSDPDVDTSLLEREKLLLSHESSNHDALLRIGETDLTNSVKTLVLDTVDSTRGCKQKAPSTAIEIKRSRQAFVSHSVTRGRVARSNAT